MKERIAPMTASVVVIATNSSDRMFVVVEPTSRCRLVGAVRPGCCGDDREAGGSEVQDDGEQDGGEGEGVGWTVDADGHEQRHEPDAVEPEAERVTRDDQGQV